jgi:glutathione S-transferase
MRASCCLYNTVQVFEAMHPTVAITDKDEKIAARKALLAPGGKIHTKMTVVEKLLEASTTKYYLGDEMSLADIFIFALISGFSSGCVPWPNFVLTFGAWTIHGRFLC